MRATTWPVLALHSASVLALGGCSEDIPDVAGIWDGSTTFLVDAETKTIQLELRLAQSGKEVSGSLSWGDIEQMISTVELKGNEIFVRSEWDEGSITLRGLVAGDRITGRFSYRYPRDPEPFPASFEVTRQ